MRFKFFGIVAFYILVCCQGYTELNRKVRNVNAGDSHFNDVSEEDIRQFHMQHSKTKACIEVSGSSLKAAVCDDNNSFQKFRFNPTGHNEGSIKNIGTNQCLFGSSGRISTRSCSDSNRNALNMVWGCYLPLDKAGSRWKSQDFVGLKLKSQNLCLSVRNDGHVYVKQCTAVQGDKEQHIFVKGAKDMSICAKSGYFGPRTNDTNYYYFKHEEFKVPNYMRYVEVFVVYGNGVYNAFVQKYGKSNAIKKIYAHAQDTHNIIDKLYRKVNIRFVVSGVKVWESGDEIPAPTNSHELHKRFGDYVDVHLKGKYHFDIALYYFDGDMYGAGGTATNSFCYRRSFVIATLGGESRLEPKKLAHTMTHEYGHEFNSPHTWDAPHTCPTYHLFGGRCTLGGNDWPKGLSSHELRMMRKNAYTCLKDRPLQKNVLQCGNGVIDEGEECDCGSSQNCLKSNPCCDGQICKLKRYAECSTEGCCSSCKWNRKRSGCQGKSNSINADHGTIVHSKDNLKNVYESWKITTSPGTKVVVFLTMSLFEFEEGCPFDYIKVYDGGNENSRLIGTFCRTPPNMKVEATSNEIYVVLKTDSSHDSHFKLTYTTQSEVQPSDLKTYFLRTYDLRCLKASGDYVVSSSNCADKFVFTSSSHLKHVATGKCVNTQEYYGRAYDNARLLLDYDCTSESGKFGLIGGKKIMHSASSLCVETLSNGRMIVHRNCKTARNGIQFEPAGTVGNVKLVQIKHYGGRCMSVNKDNKLYLTEKCDMRFKFSGNGKLVDENGNCFIQQRGGNGAHIIKSSCDAAGTSYERTAKNSLKQTTSKICMHPDGGYANPQEGTLLVLWAGCDENRLSFKFIETSPPTQAPPPASDLITIKHYGGLCVAVNTNDNQLFLTSKCTTKFRFTKNGEIQDASGLYCFSPTNDYNGARFVKSLCGIDGSSLSKESYGSLKHIASGRCIHPDGGYLRPGEGTKLVLYSGCNATKLKFSFIKA